MRKFLLLFGSFCFVLGQSQSARSEEAASLYAAPGICNAVRQGMVAYEDSKFQRASSEEYGGNPNQFAPNFDVNNDGKPDWVIEVCGGTAHACGPEITLNDSALPDILSAYDRGELYAGSSENPGYFRLLHDGSRNYMVYFADERRRYPRMVTYISQHNREFKVCEFA